MTELLSPAALEAGLRQIGAERYHNLHPFHRLLHGGKLDLGQVQAWALNRYYYQCMIPIKDSALMSHIPDPGIRREWRHRLEDHDGAGNAEGGIERWLKLTDGLGLDREYVISTRGILPGTRFAVDAYVTYVKEHTPLEGMASSLTEMFAPAIHRERIEGMLKNYDFISDDVMAYFQRRLTQAPRDAEWVLAYVKKEARSPEQQQAVLAALRFKCDVLWAQLDALYHAYVEPKHVPPGAFRPDDRAPAHR
jgi:coenzyme PQQ biosynthesis protein C